MRENRQSKMTWIMVYSHWVNPQYCGDWKTKYHTFKSQKFEGYKRIYYLLEIKSDSLTGGNTIMIYIRQQKTGEE